MGAAAELGENEIIPSYLIGWLSLSSASSRLWLCQQGQWVPKSSGSPESIVPDSSVVQQLYHPHLGNKGEPLHPPLPLCTHPCNAHARRWKTDQELGRRECHQMLWIEESKYLAIGGGSLFTEELESGTVMSVYRHSVKTWVWLVKSHRCVCQ